MLIVLCLIVCLLRWCMDLVIVEEWVSLLFCSTYWLSVFHIFIFWISTYLVISCAQFIVFMGICQDSMFVAWSCLIIAWLKASLCLRNSIFLAYWNNEVSISLHITLCEYAISSSLAKYVWKSNTLPMCEPDTKHCPNF
jgi:hypothetical protein